jgi:Family of unknown function (DUF5678)
MASAAVSVAPVLTPQTLGVLADTLERANLPEQALSLRRLGPFVVGVVERHFLPLVAPTRKIGFASRFSRLAREFEPVHLYLNFRLFPLLGTGQFFSVYARILNDTLKPLLDTAREMDMGPELISAAVHDYMRIMRALGESADPPKPQAVEPTLDQFMAFVDWFRASTRFDYGLTAIFLILDGSIPKPVPADKGALLSACGRALLDFAREASKAVANENVHRACRDLETSHVRLRTQGRRFRDVMWVDVAKKPPITASSRGTEINWLTQNKELSDRYGGQWIVLEKDELVASDTDYKKARDVAIRRGIKRPFIIFVPPRGSGGFMGI